MTNRARVRFVLVVLAYGLAGCGGSGVSPTPSTPSPVTQPAAQPVPQAPEPIRLLVFTELSSGFSTSDARDVQGQIVQFDTGGGLTWTADGTRLTGYRSFDFLLDGAQVYVITGKICPQGCQFEIRFGTKGGERQAYLTVDYGHDNPGTLVDVELVGGELVVTQTNVFPPGSPTLSGVVSEVTAEGQVPVEGVKLYVGISSGYREAITDKHGFYSIPGLFTVRAPVHLTKDGYETRDTRVSIDGDTRLDVQVVRR